MQNNIVPLNHISELLSLSERRIQQLAKLNVIVKTNRGEYDLTKSIQGYIQYLQSHKLDEKVLECNQERAKLYHLQAKLKEKELALLEQSLIPMQQVEDLWSALMSNAKTKLLNLPKSVAPIALTYDNRLELEEYLYQSIHTILTELADEQIALNFTAQNSEALEATTETQSQ